MLPDLDGMAFCQQLRQAEAQTPILMLTARDAISDRIARLNAGADDYLPKPFAFDEIKEVLYEELRARKHDELLYQFQEKLFTEANIILNGNDMDANSPAALREEYASTSIPLSISSTIMS